jgi:hypothetical protein
LTKSEKIFLVQPQEKLILLPSTIPICPHSKNLELFLQYKFLDHWLTKKAFGTENKKFGKIFKTLLSSALAVLLVEEEIN